MAESRLDIKMGMDTTAVQRGLTSVKAQIDGFAKEKFAGFKEMFGVGAALAGMKVLGDKMIELRRRSEDIGASTDFLQSLEMLSVKFGGTADSANGALLKLTEVIGQARTEGGAAEEKFKRFGVSLYDVNGQARNTEEIFKEIADAYKNSSDASTKAALALEFFGKTGRDINNILGEGKTGIDAYTQSMKSIGLIAGEANVNALADAWTNLKANIGGAAATILGTLARAAEVYYRFLGALSAGAGIKGALKIAVEEPDNKADRGNREGDDARRREANAKAIEDLQKARSNSAAAQMTDEQKLVQVEKQRVEIEAKMREQSAGSAEFIKLENELLLKGYEARKLQLDIAARLVEQEKMGQQLDAAKAEFKVLEVAKQELELKLQIAALNEGDPRRAGMEKELVGLVRERANLERGAKELELKQMQARKREIDEEIKGLGFGDDAKLARQKKQEDRDKAILEIAKKAKEIEEDKLDVLRKQGDAQERATRARQTLTEAKESRFKFTLEELAAADPRRFRGGVRESVMGARDVQRLEALAMQANLRNDPKERDRLQELADKRRESLGFLKKEERFPFQDLKMDARKSAEELQALLKSGKTKTQVAMAG